MGSGGWCTGYSGLSLTASEPLAGYSITVIEGTLNGERFACPGASCIVDLDEGQNDFTFWALSSWGDSSLMGTASGKRDSQPPQLGLEAGGDFCPACGESAGITVSVTDTASGVAG
jgi:hypothetical protein